MNQTPSVILIGFMASGKSTVGKLLAARLSLPFADTDTLAERRAGMSIPEIFRTQGEAAFRELEHEIATALRYFPASVIATGGGMPTFARNVPLLKEAGVVVLLDRPFDAIWHQLAGGEGRPLAGGRSREELRALYEARLPLYRAAANIVVPNVGTARQTADLLLPMLGAWEVSTPAMGTD